MSKHRFFDKVDKSGPNGCWIWTASKTGKGYGRFWLEGKQHSAHRVSWEIHNGPIPEDDSYHGICVCHTCDNPSCVNPEHLFLGSNYDNVLDRHSKGRSSGGAPPGQDHYRSKLTENQVIEIRSLCGKISQRKLASMYGVDHSTINLIHNRKIWTHI